MSELNQSPYSNGGYRHEPEINSVETKNRFPEYSPVKEFTTFSELAGTEHTPSGKAKNMASHLKTLLTAFAIVTVAAVSLFKLIPINLDAVLSHASVFAEEDRICYSYAFDDFQSGDTITVRVFNDFTNYTESFKDSWGSGEAEGLKPGMLYTIEFRYKGTVVFSHSLYAGSDDCYEYSRSTDHPVHATGKE